MWSPPAAELQLFSESFPCPPLPQLSVCDGEGVECSGQQTARGKLGISEMNAPLEAGAAAAGAVSVAAGARQRRAGEPSARG